VDGLDSPRLEAVMGAGANAFRDEIELVQGASDPFALEEYLAARQTPVFFGSAIQNFGVRELLEGFVEYAPPPQPSPTSTRVVEPDEKTLTGFVFKIQANMDPGHRDRIAFLRICSGTYRPGMRMFNVRVGKEQRIADAITFLASDRHHTEEAFAGDIIGLHNHGTINIGDTFTEGEKLYFTGVPNFAPELFRRVVLRDPLRLKALQKGLSQLCEEGATQLFRPMINNSLILGAVGPLQFDVVAFRLADEYGVDCAFEPVRVATARWVVAEDSSKLADFRKKANENLALDHADQLVYIAPTQVNLSLTQERWPDVQFHATREHAFD
jgi:peptide chain release factor 3